MRWFMVKNNVQKILIFLLPIIFLAALPMALSRYWIHVTIITFYYIILATSWDLLAGYSGQISFGHAAFASIGAYTAAMLAIDFSVPTAIALIAGAMVACLIAAALGAACVKMGGAYLALTALGFSELVRLVLVNEREYTRGPMGLHVPPLFEGQTTFTYYYVQLAMTVISVIAMYKILYSQRGLVFKAILNDEVAAGALGVDVVRERLFAFSIAGFFAGLAGALYAFYIGLITPSMGALLETFNAVSMTVIGGYGTLIGPLIGAPLLYISSELLRAYGELRYLTFGILVIIVIRFAPEGLVGLLKKALIIIMRKGLAEGER
jgi:branched-chain amino acid transport system permease protein